MEKAPEKNEALEDLKVIDFGWAIAAPTLCWFLATHGATVIRVETSKRPDVYRVSAPYKDRKPGLNRAGFFAYPNVNKLSIALDLGLKEAVEVAKKLVAWADVVVDNFRVGPMEKWGLGYEDLKEIKPEIIMLRTTNQGLTGPYNKQAGWGWQLAGLCGISHLSGWPDREPLSFGVPYTDVIAPRFGVAALMAALVHRNKTGEGQLIDLSQLETSLHFIAPTMINFFANNEEGKRTGNDSPDAAPHGVYRCEGEDRWCAICVDTDQAWEAFCKAIGDPSWTRDLKFTHLVNRKKNQEELDRLVEAWTSKQKAEDVMVLLQKAGVPAGVVQTGKEVFEDVQLNARNYFWTLDHPEMGPFAHLGSPFDLKEAPARPRIPAPCLGEHNEYVCTKILGMPDEEFLDLLTKGVFE